MDEMMDAVREATAYATGKIREQYPERDWEVLVVAIPVSRAIMEYEGEREMAVPMMQSLAADAIAQQMKRGYGEP